MPKLIKRISETSYGKHDRCWIPIHNIRALDYYLNHLFLPYSRGQLLLGALARAIPFFKWPILNVELVNTNVDSDNFFNEEYKTLNSHQPILGEGIEIENFSRFLGGHLQSLGICRSSSLQSLAIDRGSVANRNQLALLLFEDNSVDPCAIAKIALAGSQQLALKREFKILRELHNSCSAMLKNTIPKPIDLIGLDEVLALLEINIPGKLMYFDIRNRFCPRFKASQHFTQAIDWLIKFQTETRIDHNVFGDSIIVDYVISPLEKYQHKFKLTKEENQFIDRTIDDASKLSGKAFFMAPSQGDFWAGNIIVHNNNVSVLDWEKYENNDIPFKDLFMFFTSYGMNYPWKWGRVVDPTLAFGRTFLKNTWLSVLIRLHFISYCKKMGITPDLPKVFFPVFLAQKALDASELSDSKLKEDYKTFYKSLDSADDFHNRVNRWRKIFQEYAHQRGSVCFG